MAKFLNTSATNYFLEELIKNARDRLILISPFFKLTTSKLAQKLGVRTADVLDRLVTNGLLELRDGKHYITNKGKDAGGEFRMSRKFGPYFLWPENVGF